MNTEELKIIMDALVQLGEAGKSGFIWWLVMKYAMHYVTVIFFIAAAAFTVRMIAQNIVATSHGNQLGMELCKMLNTTDNQYHGWDNESYRAATKAEILNKVRALLAAQPK